MEETVTQTQNKKKQDEASIYDSIIVGGGFAGLTAAIYLIRAGRRVLVLESNVPGGQITTSHLVENWPASSEPISGMELGAILEKQVKDLGVEVEWGIVDSIAKLDDLFLVQTESKQLFGKTVIYAAGVSPKPLGVKGEDEYRGRGVSFCATCDGAFYKDKTVVVIGGGNSAIEEAMYLSKIVKKLYIIHRRDKFRADIVQVNKLKSINNVEFVLDSVVDELVGENGALSAVLVRNVKTEETSLINCEGAFVYVGIIPNTEMIATMVKLNESGFVLAGEDTATAVKGLFVAGDLRAKVLRQLVTAASDGATAATMANHFLN